MPAIHHIFNRPDLSVVSVNHYGEVKVISSNARAALNEANEKKPLGEDFHYLKAITCDPELQSLGVYTATVSPDDVKVQVCDK